MEETIPKDTAPFHEKLARTIAERIKKAEENPILGERVEELESEIKNITDAFIDRGFPSSEGLLRGGSAIGVQE